MDEKGFQIFHETVTRTDLNKKTPKSLKHSSGRIQLDEQEVNASLKIGLFEFYVARVWVESSPQGISYTLDA